MPVARLSQKTIDKLARAGEYAEKLYLEGYPALEALVKAADEYDLRGEQAHLLVRGWNTSHVRDLMTRTKEASQRLQDLDLVDIHTFDATRRSKSKEKPKQASAEEVWIGYYREPAWQLNKSEPPFQPMEDPSALERQVKQAEQLIEKRYRGYESTVKLASVELTRLREELTTKLAQARRDVISSQLDPRVVAENLKVAHPSAYRVFKTIEDTIPVPEDPNQYCFYDSRKIPYSTLISCGELAEKVARYELAYRQLCEQFATIKKAVGKDIDVSEGVELLDPALNNPNGFYTPRDFYQPPQPLISSQDLRSWLEKEASPVPPPQPIPSTIDLSSLGSDKDKDDDRENDPFVDKQTQAFLKELTSQLGKLFSSLGGSSFPSGAGGDVSGKVKEKIFSKHTQSVTRAMRMPGMVVRLMATDDILSQYPPSKVQEAFTYLHEIAPLMMENPAVAREFLRKYLAQGETLDSYDMKLLVDMEVRRRKAMLSEPLD